MGSLFHGLTVGLNFGFLILLLFFFCLLFGSKMTLYLWNFVNLLFAFCTGFLFLLRF